MGIKDKVRPLPFSDEDEIWSFLDELKEKEEFKILPLEDKEEVEEYIRDIFSDYEIFNSKLI